MICAGVHVVGTGTVRWWGGRFEVIRRAIVLRKKVFAKTMDCRVKPGNDGGGLKPRVSRGPAITGSSACADDDIRAVRQEGFMGAAQHEALRAFTAVFAGCGEMMRFRPGPITETAFAKVPDQGATLRAAPHPGHAVAWLMPRTKTTHVGGFGPKTQKLRSRVAKQGGGGSLVLRDGRFAASSA